MSCFHPRWLFRLNSRRKRNINKTTRSIVWVVSTPPVTLSNKGLLYNDFPTKKKMQRHPWWRLHPGLGVNLKYETWRAGIFIFIWESHLRVQGIHLPVQPPEVEVASSAPFQKLHRDHQGPKFGDSPKNSDLPVPSSLGSAPIKVYPQRGGWVEGVRRCHGFQVPCAWRAILHKNTWVGIDTRLVSFRRSDGWPLLGGSSHLVNG